MVTVLVVDDAAIIREPVAAALRLQGYTTACAGSGAEALERVAVERPDLILLDLAMPDMDGLAFLRQINAQFGLGTIPVILLTAVSEKDYILQAGQLGVRDYLLKSRFSLVELVNRIENRLKLFKDEATAAGKAPASPPAAIAQDAAAAAAPPAAAKDAPPSPPPPAKPAAETKAASPNHKPTPPKRVSPPSASDAPPAEAIKVLKPLLTRSEMAEHLEETDELKALSPTVAQLLNLTARPDCSIDQATRMIRQDQALSLKMLKLANSVLYNRGEPVETIHKAVMRIGLSQIRQAVINISVMEQFSENNCGAHLVSSLFWEHSIACGLISAALTRHVGGTEMEVDSAFTSGLLHDVGRLVYAEKFPEIYEQVLNAAYEMQVPLEMVESRMLLVNHADAMDRVLHSWNFPKHLINPIAFHHLALPDIGRMARTNSREVTILAAANRLAHALLLGYSGNPAVYPTQDMLRSLDVNEALFADLASNIYEQTDDMRLGILSTTQEENWRPQRSVFREKLARPLRPLYVTAAPHLDAMQLLFDRLRETDASEPPNIAVVHLFELRERPALTEQLLAAEQQANVKHLPLLLLAPRPNAHLEEPAMINRRSIVLPMPTTVLRMLDAVNSLLTGG